MGLSGPKGPVDSSQGFRKMKRIVWRGVATIVVLIGSHWRCLLLFKGQYRQTYFRELACHLLAGTDLFKEGLRRDSRAILDRAFENDRATKAAFL